MNLAFRDVRHSLFRFVLTCLGLGLLMAVVLAMMGIYKGLVVEADTQGPFAEASKIPNDKCDAGARPLGVAQAGSIPLPDHRGTILWGNTATLRYRL